MAEKVSQNIKKAAIFLIICILAFPVFVSAARIKKYRTNTQSRSSAKQASARREREAPGSAGAELKKLMRQKGATFLIVFNHPSSPMVDIVDANGMSVSSPSVGFSARIYSFSSQTSTGTLGVAAQRIRVSNPTSTATWTLSMAATAGTTALWNTGSLNYDYNDANGATDGSDADAYGGQLTINPTTGTVAAVSPCASTTGITKGSSSSFSETAPVVSSITLLTADSSAATSCSWDFTGISLSQIIPAVQAIGTYTLPLTLTIV